MNAYNFTYTVANYIFFWIQTLVTEKDREFAGHLVRNLEGANQEVPEDLLELAMQSSWFRSSRFKSGKAKSVGGTGLGYKERPGLGMEETKQNTPQFSSSSSHHPSSGDHSHRSSGSGPATNRFAAMREAFRNQYTSQVNELNRRKLEKIR